VKIKKQALLDAATAAFAQSESPPQPPPSPAAPVAEGTLFRYFATKDDLLNELYLLQVRLVQDMIAGLNPNETRPKENAAISGTAISTGACATRWSIKRFAGWR
jgi:hypothetical protein